MQPHYCTVLDICASQGEWLTFWGGLLGSFTAVLFAYGLERGRERRARSAMKTRLRTTLTELRERIAPYLPLEVRQRGELEEHVPPEVWRSIVDADTDIRWVLSNQLVAGADLSRAVGVLARTFRRKAALIDLAAEHLDTHGTLHNEPSFKKPLPTHWIAVAIEGPLDDVLKVL